MQLYIINNIMQVGWNIATNLKFISPIKISANSYKKISIDSLKTKPF